MELVADIPGQGRVPPYRWFMEEVVFPVLWALGRKAHRCKESLQQGQALVKLKLCFCSAWKEARLRWRKAWHCNGARPCSKGEHGMLCAQDWRDVKLQGKGTVVT